MPELPANGGAPDGLAGATDLQARLRSLLLPAWRPAGREPPAAEPVAVEALPPGVRPLLAHERGMTATLAEHWHGEIRVRVLASEPREAPDMPETFYRFAALCCAAPARLVAVAALRLPPGALSPEFLRCLRGTTVPFGRLLRDAGIPFRSLPLGFFVIEADPVLAAAGEVAEGRRLFGRLVRLVGAGPAFLGEAVEILPRIPGA